MKNLTTLLFLLISTIIIAQEEEKEQFKIEKGTWTIEGSLGISQRMDDALSYNDNSDFYFGIFPKIGYAINENLVLGLGLGYAYSKSTYNFTEEAHEITTSNSFRVIPYIKKYIPLNEKLACHFLGEIQFGTINRTSKRSDQDFEHDYLYKIFDIGVRPGITYAMSNKILLQANYGYLGYFSQSHENAEKINVFELDLDSSSLIIGLSVVL